MFRCNSIYNINYLKEKYNVKFIWGTAITSVSSNAVYAGKTKYSADIICVCSGADFETLYPEQFKQQPTPDHYEGAATPNTPATSPH